MSVAGLKAWLRPPSADEWRAAAPMLGLYAVAAVIGWLLAGEDALYVRLRPVQGVALVALATSPRMLWPVAAGAFFECALFAVSIQPSGAPLVPAVAITVAVALGTVIPAVAGALVIRGLGGRRGFDRDNDWLALLVGALVQAGLVAFSGLATVINDIPIRQVHVASWFAASLSGILAVAPALWLTGNRRFWATNARHLVPAFVAIGLASFASPEALNGFPTAFLPLLGLAYLAWAQGTAAMAAGYAALALAVAVATRSGMGPLAAMRAPTVDHVVVFTGYLFANWVVLFFGSRVSDHIRTAMEGYINSERRLKRLIDGFPAMAVLVEGDTVLVNRAAEDLVGYTPGELSHLSAWKGLFEDRGQVPFAHVGAGARMRATLRRKDGAKRIFELSGAPLPDGSVWLMVDDTDRVEAEERFRAVFDHSDDALLLLEGNVIVDGNRAAGRIMGVPQLQGLALKDVCELKVATGTVDPATLSRDVQRQGAGRIIGTLTRSSGVSIPVEVMALPVDSGGRKLMLAALRDRTERQRREDELRQAKEKAELGLRARNEFLATMSHEIRTPLNGVIGLAQVLQTTRLTLEQREHVRTMTLCAESLLSVLTDLLDFSKLEAGRMPSKPLAMQPTAPAEEVVRMFTPRAQERGIILRSVVADTLPTAVRADPMHIRQILLNLVGNAVKFTEVGSVTVRIGWERPDFLVYEVQDTGIGIDPAYHHRLFEPFSQVDTGSTRKYDGTGLGLAISKRLAENMGGTLSFTSRPGEGSRFRLALPVEALKVAGDASGALAGAASDKLKANVLVAEDNAVNQLVTRSLLERLGAKVTVVEDGEAVVHAARRKTYDLILMDCQMPRRDGYDATRMLRAMGCKVPIVALTASAMDGDREKCAAVGMDDHLAKPVAMEDLRRTLLKWVPTCRPAEGTK